MTTTTMELVFIPTPGMGHLLATVELAKHLLRHNNHLSAFILIINLPNSNPSLVNAFLDSQSKDNPYPSRLIFHPLPTPPTPPGPISFSPVHFQTLIDLYKPFVKQSVEERMQTGSSRKLSAFVLDMFCISMMDIAQDFNVPWYVFFTSGVSLLNVLFHIQPLIEGHGVDIATRFSDPDIELDVPGFANRLKGENLPPVIMDKEHGTKMVLHLAQGLRKSKGILVNSYMELETNGLQALFDQVSKGSIPSVYPVGPILELDKKSRSGSNSQNEESNVIIEWLNEQPSCSVVFLCFGSKGTFNAEQVSEIAKGLEKSEVRFLWSLRKPPPKGVAVPSVNEIFLEALPEGFLERTSNRGKVIGWAPQVEILAHRAIGGFVSHCGWNSTLESMWFGVPMATWPLEAEQQLNAFVLVKELGIGVEIRMDYRLNWTTREANFKVSEEEVESGVRRLMGLDEGIRERIKGMSKKSRKSLEEGGSSYEWLGRFIEDVSSNVSC